MDDLSTKFHEPVLVVPALQFLLTQQSEIIVDATLGDGGHSLALLEKGGTALRVIGIDTDAEALAVARSRLERFTGRYQLLQGNFRSLTQLLGSLGITNVDGVLADLGVSSRQIDQPERGFSYLQDGPLDMRMNPNLPHTAADLLATLAPDALRKIFREYGEEKLAAPIARAIVKQRVQQPLLRTRDLRQIVENIVHGPNRVKSLARIFQALRIAVNQELEALKEFLVQAVALLRPGGRLVVISYHSLEDRIVKQFFKTQARGCTCPPQLPVCICGKQSQLSILTVKPIVPGPREVSANIRARSARLRAAQKR
ncbi:MAG: 16S rRNA (cytosine(1402)-N(4))-methyltransferase RsmH [candidate division KSB1 bacterium]|nr:16S rRNA (cytosine(1402)-N(4))-methyltransferase RsmH [candidate division KSB1 bacterium]MDZ7301560.1 16S rRNA (cytosine(1402)-N(4))-methyltransferase RsmH [candidate division KSB1 bacterium]MDZ7311024.1 16S rRNA (cytosine(1402)-N(4))-methyltransferase RsmH [candidate division KSB1 bacterium]